MKRRRTHAQAAPDLPVAGETVVDQVRLEVDGERIALVARVSAPQLEATDVCLRVYAPELAARVDASATPLLPVCTMLAARLGTDLVIDAPVDAGALENAHRATAILEDWWGWPRPSISPASRMPAIPPAPGAGLWFSRGVDSTDTLLRARDGEVVEDGRRIELTHLLGLDWIDPPYAVSSMPEIWAGTEEAAASIGLPLLRFATDVRRVLEPFVPWDRSYVAVLAGLGILLGPVLGSVLITAGASEGEAAPPYGSHALLDPLWSTSGTRIVHASRTRGRCEKVARLARDPWALARLKVCWEVDTPRNCGRCAKCLSTMTALHLAKALDRCDRFDGELTPAAVLALVQEPSPLDNLRSSVADLLRNLPDEDVELRAAWEVYRERLMRELAASH